MNIEHELSRAFSRRLVSTAKGRAYLLNQLADAEDNGEATIFDECLAKVDDPKLQQMITRHRDDEIRHGALFRARVVAQGFKPHDMPEEQQILFLINEKLDGFFDKPIADARGVMDAYLILQAIEERAVEQFGMFVELFQEVDPESAAVLREVLADERRHLRYCEAISRRYAPDEATRTAALEHYRAVEADAYDEARRNTMHHLLDTKVITPRASRWLWRAIDTLALAFRSSPFQSLLARPAHAAA
jgi:rubrerythrin